VAELRAGLLGRSLTVAGLTALLALPARGGEPPEALLRLPIGDPARRHCEAPLVLDAVTDSSSGELLTPTGLAKALGDVRLLLVGEEHTDMETHRVEKRILAELVGAGRTVVVALEMYPFPEQRWLDEWTAGRLSEEGFVEGSRWYRNWGYNWLYYRDIFLFARDNRLRMVAVNAPREVVSALRKKGWSELAPEQAAHVPEKIDTRSADYLRLFKAHFEDESFHAAMTEKGWQAMLDVQCTWDATMGWNAVRALSEDPDPNRIVVVLVGAGHVEYGLGIERQVRAWYGGKVASVIPVPVEDPEEGPAEAVQASYASYVWGIPPEIGPLYPDLGIATRFREEDRRLEILDVARDTPAKRAGLEVKDVLVSMDGTPIADGETLSRLVAEKRWGDETTIVVSRGSEVRTLTVLLRREVPENAKPPGP
jgi:uncharacterized iron-regulated protein